MDCSDKCCGSWPRGHLSSHCSINSSRHCNIDSVMRRGLIPCLSRKEAIMARSYLQRVALVLAAGIILSAASLPAFADRPLTNLGPVGPGEPILITVRDQRVIAFYTPERGACAVSAVMWKDTGGDARSTRVRLSLKPGQTLQLDGSQRQSMSLLCGADATTLALVAPAELLLTGVTGRN
jgi:hypothetical protein